MSLGVGAYADLVLEDEETLIYQYGDFNLNKDAYRNAEKIQDGLITIAKSCLVEPEIHEKIKRLPSGRKKLIVKRIPVYVDYSVMMKEGLIIIENCSTCWKVSADEYRVDFMAYSLVSKFFREYQETGGIPTQLTITK